jgi:kumamolisin
MDAFGVELTRYEHPDGNYRGRQGPVMVPTQLADAVEGVFGLDNRPQAQPRVRLVDRAARAGTSAFTPPEVAALYDFPTGATGKGECIGIIELGAATTEPTPTRTSSRSG